MTASDLRSRIERAVGGIMRPSLDCTPHPDEIAIVDAVMAEVERDRTRRCGLALPHRPHGWSAARQSLRCPGVGDTQGGAG